MRIFQMMNIRSQLSFSCQIQQSFEPPLKSHIRVQSQLWVFLVGKEPCTRDFAVRRLAQDVLDTARRTRRAVSLNKSIGLEGFRKRQTSLPPWLLFVQPKTRAHTHIAFPPPQDTFEPDNLQRSQRCILCPRWQCSCQFHSSSSNCSLQSSLAWRLYTSQGCSCTSLALDFPH